LPAGNLFIQCLCSLARRSHPKYATSLPTDLAFVRPAFQRFDVGESAGRPETGSRRPGDFGGFCRFIRLVRCSASQCSDRVVARSQRSSFPIAIARRFPGSNEANLVFWPSRCRSLGEKRNEIFKPTEMCSLRETSGRGSSRSPVIFRGMRISLFLSEY